MAQTNPHQVGSKDRALVGTDHQVGARIVAAREGREPEGYHALGVDVKRGKGREVTRPDVVAICLYFVS